MIIDFSYIGSGGGGGYVLPTATDSRLGGVKVGSGLTVDSGGTLSVSGGSGSNITIYDINELSGYTGQQLYAVYQEILGKIESGLTDYAFQYKVEGNIMGLSYSGIVYTQNVSYNPENYLITIDFGEYKPLNADEVNEWPSYKIVASIFADVDYPVNTSLEIVNTEVVPTIASQSKLGNVKVGSGLTIDSGGTLSVSGGSAGEQSYVIVDALSAVTSPTEGMLVYKKDRTYVETIEYYKLQINPNDYPEGDIGGVYIDGSQLGSTRVYQSGSIFYWDWTNDGRLNERTQNYNGVDYTFKYKTYNDSETQTNSYFLFEKSLGGLAAVGGEVLPYEEGKATVTDYSETGYTTEYGGFYQYINSAWTQLNIQKDFIFDEMTDSERATLYSTISNMTASDVNKVFAFFLFEEIDGNRDEYQVQFIGFYENQARFGTVVPKLTNEGSNIKMPYVNIDADGTMHKEAGEIRQYNTTKLSIRRDAEYLGFDAGSYSGYTFDFTNVADYTENVIDWENSNNEWILKVQKWDNGLKNGDWSDYTDDNKFHFVNRSLSGVEYLYYYKRTGMTLTVLFVSNPPSSVGDLNINQDATYSAEAATAVNYYWTNREDFNEFFTGNTASDAYQFEVISISQFADGSGDDNQVPKLALRIRKNDGNLYSAYGNPVIKYEMLAQNVVIYDKDNEPRNFNMKFYFYYGEYTVSLLAGNDNEYRYAQLTITDNS